MFQIKIVYILLSKLKFIQWLMESQVNIGGRHGRDRMIVGSRGVPNTLSDKVCQ